MSVSGAEMPPPQHMPDGFDVVLRVLRCTGLRLAGNGKRDGNCERQSQRSSGMESRHAVCVCVCVFE